MTGAIGTTQAASGKEPNGFNPDPDDTTVPTQIIHFDALTETVTRDHASATIVKRAQP
ncbi:MAG: hypothetical protein ACXVKQ_06295 [Acidimicrobiia bacterium]